MHRVPILCLFLAAASPAAANSAGCGDNAFTFAEVVEHAPGARSRGPVMTVPDSLCADVIEDRGPGIGSLSVHIGEPYGDDAGATGASRLRPRLPAR